MNIHRPIYLQKLIDRRHSGMIKIITGMRRSQVQETIIVKHPGQTPRVLHSHFHRFLSRSSNSNDYFTQNVSKMQISLHMSKFVKRKQGATASCFRILLTCLREITLPFVVPYVHDVLDGLCGFPH